MNFAAFQQYREALLRERVAVYGGDLDARRRLGGGYRVRARIPLDRP